MTFLAFNLTDFHQQNKDGVKVRVRFVGAKSLEAAKQFMQRYYPGSWAIVSKKAFDQGIVHNHTEEKANESRLQDRA
jgi:hypothetical protein